MIPRHYHFPARNSFLTVKRRCNEDHWTSEVTISVHFLHYFLRLLICRTVFKDLFHGRKQGPFPVTPSAYTKLSTLQKYQKRALNLIESSKIKMLTIETS